MLVGAPREIKDHEYRVGLTPAGVHALCERGHQVCIETGAGARIGFHDGAYISAGARIVASAKEIFAADMVVKVKELQPAEFSLPRRGQILFAYLHLAPDPDLLHALLACGVSGIAYETVTDAQGRLPLLAPMSRIAGRLSVQVGAWALQMANGGSGVLLGGVPGVAPGRVVVIGAGACGANAVQIAAGMGADVTVLDIDLERLAHLDEVYRGRVKTCYSEALAIAEQVARRRSGDRSASRSRQARPQADLAQAPATHATGLGAGGRCDRSGRHRRDLAPDFALRSRCSLKKAWCTTASRTCPRPARAPQRWR